MKILRHDIFSIIALLSLSLWFVTPSFAANGKIDSLKAAISTSGSDSDKIKILIRISELTDCTDTVGKLYYANEAKKVAEGINWKKGIACAYILTGDIYNLCIKNRQLAIHYCQQGYLLSKSANDENNEMKALIDLGSLYKSMGEYSNALDCYRKLLAICRSPDHKMSTLGNIGSIFFNLGAYPQALIYYDSSLKVLDESIKLSGKNEWTDTMLRGGLLITIADVYLAMSQYDKVQENYNTVLQLSKNKNNDILTLLALMGKGRSSHQKKDHAKAIEYYLEALQKSKVSKIYAKHEVEILNDLANVYIETNQIDTALHYTLTAIDLIDCLNYPVPISGIYITLGKIYSAKKNYKEAVAYLQKAISVCNKNSDIINLKKAWEALSNTYTGMNDPTNAFNAFKNFIAIRDSLYNFEKINELTRIDVEYKFDKEKQITADANHLKMQKQKMFTYSGFAGLAVVLLLSFFIYRNYNHQKKANIAISKANEVISDEKQKAEGLLRNILPEDVAKELKTNGNVHARRFDNVTVLFTDFVNFTEAGERFSPEELVAELHTCFMAFDRIIGKYNIEKIKTVGDAYLAVSGLPHPNPNHASDLIKAAIECRDFMLERKKKFGDRTFAMRIGINSGTVVAGIVGVKKFAYDIWGDTVNTAARMEQYSEPGMINISQPTYELVKGEFACTDRGEIDAKHKGKMRMYFVEVAGGKTPLPLPV